MGQTRKPGTAQNDSVTQYTQYFNSLILKIPPNDLSMASRIDAYVGSGAEGQVMQVAQQAGRRAQGGQHVVECRHLTAATAPAHRLLRLLLHLVGSVVATAPRGRRRPRRMCHSEGAHRQAQDAGATVPA